MFKIEDELNHDLMSIARLFDELCCQAGYYLLEKKDSNSKIVFETVHKCQSEYCKNVLEKDELAFTPPIPRLYNFFDWSDDIQRIIVAINYLLSKYPRLQEKELTLKKIQNQLNLILDKVKKGGLVRWVEIKDAYIEYQKKFNEFSHILTSIKELPENNKITSTISNDDLSKGTDNLQENKLPSDKNQQLLKVADKPDVRKKHIPHSLSPLHTSYNYNIERVLALYNSNRLSDAERVTLYAVDTSSKSVIVDINKIRLSVDNTGNLLEVVFNRTAYLFPKHNIIYRQEIHFLQCFNLLFQVDGFQVGQSYSRVIVVEPTILKEPICEDKPIRVDKLGKLIVKQ